MPRKTEVPLQLTERQIHECLSALAMHDEDLSARRVTAKREGDTRLAELLACRLDVAYKAQNRLNEALEHAKL